VLTESPSPSTASAASDRVGTLWLDQLLVGQDAEVVAVSVNEGVTDDILRRLSELGFLSGERVRVLARGIFGGFPIAVRVGTATFALRRMEARCISVAPLTRSAP